MLSPNISGALSTTETSCIPSRCAAAQRHLPDDFDYLCILEEGELVGQVDVIEGVEEKFSVYTNQNAYFPLKADEANNLEKKVYLENQLYAPVQKGQIIGYVDIWLGGNKIYSQELTAPNTIGENSYRYNLFKVLDFWINSRLLDM